MNQEELNKIIENHRHWLRQDCENWKYMRANFIGFDLEGVDFARANFEGAVFSRVSLKDANLISADLTGAIFTGADLENANLEKAILVGANLAWANLIDTNFTGADLTGAELTYANLESANLTRASLKYAELKGVNLAKSCLTKADLTYTDLAKSFNAPFIPMACPTKGSFIGWKKAKIFERTLAIVELLIPEDARRSSATDRKCRCDKAKVLSITSFDGSEQYKKAYSIYDHNFVYEVGKDVSVPDFCEERFKECAAGIHFFINREEAVRY